MHSPIRSDEPSLRESPNRLAINTPEGRAALLRLIRESVAADASFMEPVIMAATAGQSDHIARLAAEYSKIDQSMLALLALVKPRGGLPREMTALLVERAMVGITGRAPIEESTRQRLTDLASVAQGNRKDGSSPKLTAPQP